MSTNDFSGILIIMLSLSCFGLVLGYRLPKGSCQPQAGCWADTQAGRHCIMYEKIMRCSFCSSEPNVCHFVFHSFKRTFNLVLHDSPLPFKLWHIWEAAFVNSIFMQLLATSFKKEPMSNSWHKTNKMHKLVPYIL